MCVCVCACVRACVCACVRVCVCVCMVGEGEGTRVLCRCVYVTYVCTPVLCVHIYICLNSFISYPVFIPTLEYIEQKYYQHILVKLWLKQYIPYAVVRNLTHLCLSFHKKGTLASSVDPVQTLQNAPEYETGR